MCKNFSLDILPICTSKYFLNVYALFPTVFTFMIRSHLQSKKCDLIADIISIIYTVWSSKNEDGNPKTDV